jgi:hypothetical protein
MTGMKCQLFLSWVALSAVTLGAILAVAAEGVVTVGADEFGAGLLLGMDRPARGVRRGGGGEIDGAAGGHRSTPRLSLRGNSGANSDQGSGFNDAGQVAFVASFTNGTSGVFVSDLAPTPEPGTVVLAAVCTFAICYCGVHLLRVKYPIFIAAPLLPRRLGAAASA